MAVIRATSTTAAARGHSHLHPAASAAAGNLHGGAAATAT